MTSIPDSSSTLDPSIITEGSEIRKRTRSADIRIHPWQPESDEPTHKGKNLIFYCKYCSSPSYKCQSSTTFRNHLLKNHDIDFEIESRWVDAAGQLALQTLYNQASIINQTSELDAQVLKKSLHKEVINRALISLITVHALPFRLVESEEFHTFCTALNPQVTTEVISSHAEVRKQIAKSWLLHKDAIRKKLQSSLSTIHLSVDIWTSPNRKLFLGICAQFVDYETESLSKALLALPSILSHSAEAQFKTLFPILQDYGIVRKLGAFVGDIASTNDKLCRIISSALLEKGIPWDATTSRIRCIRHIINLAVKAFLFHELAEEDRDQDYYQNPNDTAAFRNLGPLGKLHNIAVYIRSSPARTHLFTELASRGIPFDNSTRWNSWYEMLRVAIEKASEIDSYTKMHLKALKDEYLSPQDWAQLRTTVDFLKPFQRATKATEGDAATIDRILFMMDVLLQHFKKSLDKYKNDPFVAPRVLRSWQSFDKYYLKTDNWPYYAAAIILHPSRRIGYLKHAWEKKWVQPAMQAVKKLWDSFKAQEYIGFSASHEKPICEPADDLEDFDLIVRTLENFPRPQSKDKYDDYVSEPAIQISNSALHWWLDDQQRKRWPKLSQLAVNILSIAAMSAEAESVFSGARRTISWERMQLGEDTIEMIECLKYWRRNKVVEVAEDGIED